MLLSDSKKVNNNTIIKKSSILLYQPVTEVKITPKKIKKLSSNSKIQVLSNKCQFEVEKVSDPKSNVRSNICKRYIWCLFL